MSEVIVFPKPEDKRDLVFCCGSCKCTTWILQGDGNIRCAHCGNYVGNPGFWFDYSTRKVDPEKNEPNTREVVDFDTIEHAREYFFRRMSKRSDLRSVIYVCDNGSIHTWGAAGDTMTPEQREWLLEKFQTAINDLLMLPPNGTDNA